MERVAVFVFSFLTVICGVYFLLWGAYMRHWVLLRCLEKVRMTPYKKQGKMREDRRRGIVGLLYMVSPFKESGVINSLLFYEFIIHRFGKAVGARSIIMGSGAFCMSTPYGFLSRGGKRPAWTTRLSGIWCSTINTWSFHEPNW